MTAAEQSAHAVTDDVPRTQHPDPRRMLDLATELAVANVADDGGPFGAVVVLADGRVLEGVNRVTASTDPTAHAEIVAIRAACAAVGDVDLSGAVLYASCEPCPMCLAAALWARVHAVYFAASREDAAAAGFDDAAFHRYVADPAGPQARALMPLYEVRTEHASAPFEAWLAYEQRRPY